METCFSSLGRMVAFPGKRPCLSCCLEGSVLIECYLKRDSADWYRETQFDPSIFHRVFNERIIVKSLADDRLVPKCRHCDWNAILSRQTGVRGTLPYPRAFHRTDIRGQLKLFLDGCIGLFTSTHNEDPPC